MKSNKSKNLSLSSNKEEFLRLNKYLAKWAGISRRSADSLLKEGQVFLNGQKVESLGVKVHISKDKVKIKNRIVVPKGPFKPVLFYVQ